METSITNSSYLFIESDKAAVVMRLLSASNKSLSVISRFCLLLSPIRAFQQINRKHFEDIRYVSSALRNLGLLSTTEVKVSFSFLVAKASLLFPASLFHTFGYSDEKPPSNNYLPNPRGKRVILLRGGFTLPLLAFICSIQLPLSHSASPSTTL